NSTVLSGAAPIDEPREDDIALGSLDERRGDADDDRDRSDGEEDQLLEVEGLQALQRVHEVAHVAALEELQRLGREDEQGAEGGGDDAFEGGRHAGPDVLGAGVVDGGPQADDAGDHQYAAGGGDPVGQRGERGGLGVGERDGDAGGGDLDGG